MMHHPHFQNLINGM